MEANLILPIKKKWFDMILSNNKKEEYRDLTPYYLRRIFYCGKTEMTDYIAEQIINDFKKKPSIEVKNKWQLIPKNNTVEFRNGYGKKVPSYMFFIDAIKIGKGREKLGADRDKIYFVIHISKFYKWINKTAEQQLYENEGAFVKELDIDW